MRLPAERAEPNAATAQPAEETSLVTREQLLDRIAGFGVPLENLFLIAEDNDPVGVIVAWYPEVGLRSIVLENDDLAIACYDTLRESGVRRFKSWEELGEAQDQEKWEGWNTCADSRRWQQTAADLAENYS